MGKGTGDGMDGWKAEAGCLATMAGLLLCVAAGVAFGPAVGLDLAAAMLLLGAILVVRHGR